MDYFIIIFFVEFLLIGLFASGFILTQKFGQLSNLNSLIFSYSIFIILINYAYFHINLSISLIFWISLLIFFFSIIYLIIFNRNILLEKINLILKISFIPIVIFFLLAFIYGEQYYVFRGNYWDYFNYISTALLVLKNNFSEIVRVNNNIDIPLFLEVGTTNLYYRPSASLLLSFFLNIKVSNFFILGFAYKFFLIILILVSIFNFLSSLFKENNVYILIFYSLCFSTSFWIFYIYEIDALSHLASLPLFIFLLNYTINLFNNLDDKNYFFLIIFTIALSTLFIVYTELALIYIFVILIYYLFSKQYKIVKLKKNLKTIFIFSFIFILITVGLYEFSYKFLTMQVNQGFNIKNNWWAYFGGFIIGRENPIISEFFVSKFQSLINFDLSMYNLFLLTHEELINYNYKYYFLNIIPSFFGLYYLTDLNFFNKEVISIIFLVLLNILLLKHFVKNFFTILKCKNNFTQLIKSSFLVLFLLLLVFIYLKQYWSVVKLYFFLSPILWLVLTLNFKIKKKKLELNFNKYIAILLLIFPFYKLSTFNDGITRYDAFPSILNKDFKKEINWSFKDKYFKNCDLVTLNFYEDNKVNRLKNLYLSFNLIFNGYQFINKYTLKKIHASEENTCNVNDDYFIK